MSDWTIRESDPRDPRIVKILNAHLDLMRSQSPLESVHALDVDGLCDPSITFLCAWRGEDAIGCGAFKRLDATHGELKSMHVLQAERGSGIARRLVEQIETIAVGSGLAHIRLETGSQKGFEPARTLYASMGWEPCGPFEGYTDDPNSFFMTKSLLSA